MEYTHCLRIDLILLRHFLPEGIYLAHKKSSWRELLPYQLLGAHLYACCLILIAVTLAQNKCRTNHYYAGYRNAAHRQKQITSLR